jgi:prevent-host-death family protein
MSAASGAGPPPDHGPSATIVDRRRQLDRDGPEAAARRDACYAPSAGWGIAAGHIVHTCVMSESLPITVARGRFGTLVRRAAHGRERITITDHGSPAAVLMSSTELEDLEDALALAESRLREATGHSERIPHEQVRARLGLDG